MRPMLSIVLYFMLKCTSTLHKITHGKAVQQWYPLSRERIGVAELIKLTWIICFIPCDGICTIEFRHDSIHARCRIEGYFYEYEDRQKFLWIRRNRRKASKGSVKKLTNTYGQANEMKYVLDHETGCPDPMTVPEGNAEATTLFSKRLHSGRE